MTTSSEESSSLSSKTAKSLGLPRNSTQSALRFALERDSKSSLESRSLVVLLYMLLLLVWIAMNLGLIGANAGSGRQVSEQFYTNFHMFEFAGLSCLVCVEAFIIVYTRMLDWDSPLQLALLGVNVVSSFCALVIFVIDPHRFDVPAHYLEYFIQILVGSANLIFVFSAKPGGTLYRFRRVETAIVVVGVAMSILQLGIYSNIIPTDASHEKNAHFLEFSNEAMNGLFALVFAAATFSSLRAQIAEHNTRLHELAYGKRDSIDIV
eukprot:Amastigsp_a3550_21.p1 type:complete len:265 gc:universal Amastigsp_a3550_21:108-902(+)